MKFFTFPKLAVFALAAFFSASLFGQNQGKAKIHIKKSENGTTEEYTEEFDLQDGQAIQDILQELNLLDEFGQLKDGQAFEINIRKLEGEDELQNYDIQFYPNSEFTHEERPLLGVMLRGVDESTTATHGDRVVGAVITEIIEGSAASATDLQAGDVIFELDNVAVNSVGQLVELISSKSVGDRVKVGYYHDGKKKKTTAELRAWDRGENFIFNPQNLEWMSGEDYKMNHSGGNFAFPPMPEEPEDGYIWFEGIDQEDNGAFLGVTPGCGDRSAEGVSIGCVVEGSSAETMGLQAGDRITSFNGITVNSFDELSDAIANTSPGDEVKIAVIRDDKPKKFKGEIGKREYAHCEDFKIFQDFKGADEQGNLFYDYEFNFEEGDLEQLSLEIEDLMNSLNGENDELHFELDQLNNELFGGGTETPGVESEMNIRIEVAEVTDSEAAELSSGSEGTFSNRQDLVLESISFFPNPSNGQINLKFSLATDGDVEIYIFDQAGNTVYSESRMNFTGSYANTIDISDHADGAYFLQIIQKDKAYSKKIIKNS